MDFDLQGFVRLLEEEAPLEPLTIERISMLKAQVFQLERSNALVTDALNTQHDLLNSAMNALGAMRDCILAADAEAAKGQAGGDVTVSADTWSQLAAHARRAQGSRRTTVVPEGAQPRAAQHQLLQPGGRGSRAASSQLRKAGRGAGAGGSTARGWI